LAACDHKTPLHGKTPQRRFVCSTPAFSILAKRPDFLRAARAKRVPMPGFVLQARKRQPGEQADTPIRVGYTCSKKLGNAIKRNKAKRRLRAISRDVVPAIGQPGWDYVLIGRPAQTIERPFADLRDDLAKALKKLHQS
jgi:ribonuclease P protein component